MVANLPLFNAFEAHVINVTAEIVNDIPSIDPPGGEFCIGEEVLVTLDVTLDGADILYTTDGSEPVCYSNGLNYSTTGPFIVNSNTTITARSCHYRDTELVQSAIVSGDFTFVCCDGCGEDPEGSGVVLNEFLPNPEDDAAAMPDGEWVELYNLSATETIDLAGYYLTDSDSNRIDVEPCRTNTGDTIIGPNGFLVVYRKGIISGCTSHYFSLNNDSDTVSLYNYNNLIDSYSYSGSDYDSLTPTPADPNIDDSSGGSNSTVPENKSYARIPDGIGDFVDPVPTPGAPNILEVENLSGGSSSTLTPTPIPAPEAIPEPAPESAASGSTEEPVIEEEPTTDESADELPDELIEEPLEEELIEELPGEELTGEDPVVEEPISEELTEEPIKEEGLNEEEELIKDEPADEPADEPNSEPSSEPAQTPDSKPDLSPEPEPAPEPEPQTQPASDPDPVPAPEPAPSSQPTEE